ncbi:hypothetical protein SAMN03159341_103181 [Paenibacillus sp. 1_12]|uniref:hypothetical protein n=1 Tax=Paenibacillus sp. 1_12 TaxID=1566278 RepID=UPI0008E621B6|nr:hypothetical protein [Paenibacillus sp. 1_12]SFL09494.1 hypothetical protein SAMN03159341_103181 [Paenibacillus sp. 1_12]
MLEFEFEIMNGSSINLRYLFGGEWFTFNLYLSDEVWILHPFEGILLGNKEMSRLVIADMFTNKTFLVMLAKERILLSNIHSSMDLGQQSEEQISYRGKIEDQPEPANDKDNMDDMDAFIQANSIEEVIEQEKKLVLSRVNYFREILKRMFMDGLGPNDEEFDKVREIVKIYEEAAHKLGNRDDLFNGNNHKRF